MSNVQVSLLLLYLLIWYRLPVCDSNAARQVAGCATTVFSILFLEISHPIMTVSSFCFQSYYFFVCIQNLHVYRVLIVLLSVYMGCREFFNVP